MIHRRNEFRHFKNFWLGSYAQSQDKTFWNNIEKVSEDVEQRDMEIFESLEFSFGFGTEQRMI